MSDTSDSVFVEGQSVVKSTSPYDELKLNTIKGAFEEMTYVDASSMTVNEHQKLRLECIRETLRLDVGNDADLIMSIAKRFWNFVRTGD